MSDYSELVQKKLVKATEELMRDIESEIGRDMIGARIYYENREAGERWIRKEMAKMDSITVNVVPKVTVAEETAERCLQLLAMWQDDNLDKHIEGERLPDGRTVFKIVKNKEADK